MIRTFEMSFHIEIFGLDGISSPRNLVQSSASLCSSVTTGRVKLQVTVFIRDSSHSIPDNLHHSHVSQVLLRLQVLHDNCYKH